MKDDIFVRVTGEAIDVVGICGEDPGPSFGAQNVFLGVVRNSNLGRSVRSVEYDCFAPLCERSFRAIALEARAKWGPDAKICILHRHGLLNVGDVSVLIRAATPHRDESYQITRYIIEEIKGRSPIWKKETYLDGESEWVRGHALCQHRKVYHHEHGSSGPGGR